MIEKIHLYDQALAYIREDAHSTVVHDSGLKNVNGGTGVNAWEVLAREFEHYWRHIIGEEVIKALNLNPNEPMPAILLDRKYLLDTIWKTGIKDD
jgi:hypothetical protein